MGRATTAVGSTRPLNSILSLSLPLRWPSSLVVYSAHGGLDPTEEALVAGPAIALRALEVRGGATHANVSFLLLLSDDGRVWFGAARGRGLRLLT